MRSFTARKVIEDRVHVSGLIHEALVDTATRIREDRRVLQGVSTRSLVLAVPALQTRAMLYGRDYVDAEDLRGRCCLWCSSTGSSLARVRRRSQERSSNPRSRAGPGETRAGPTEAWVTSMVRTGRIRFWA